MQLAQGFEAWHCASAGCGKVGMVEHANDRGRDTRGFYGAGITYRPSGANCTEIRPRLP